jgi:hypothetical protein
MRQSMLCDFFGLPTTFLEYEYPLASILEKSNLQSNTWAGKLLAERIVARCTVT